MINHFDELETVIFSQQRVSLKKSTRQSQILDQKEKIVFKYIFCIGIQK